MVVTCRYQNTAVQSSCFWGFLLTNQQRIFLENVDDLIPLSRKKSLFIEILSLIIGEKKEKLSPCLLLVLAILSLSGLALALKRGKIIL